ncbi:hypothetical protein ACVWXO_010633 [Bradyrhizobium sp. LM2.7]
MITAWAPELVIVDEAQRVKNWNTIAARALKRIDSPYAIVLTGTPLENKLEELISIVPAGPDLETLARTSSQGRSRPRHRLQGAGEDRPNLGAHHDSPPKVGGVAAIAQPDGPECAGTND